MARPGPFLKPETRSWPVGDLKHAKLAIQYMAWGRGNRREYPMLLRRLWKIWDRKGPVGQFYDQLRSQIEGKMSKRAVGNNKTTPWDKKPFQFGTKFSSFGEDPYFTHYVPGGEPQRHLKAETRRHAEAILSEDFVDRRYVGDGDSDSWSEVRLSRKAIERKMKQVSADIKALSKKVRGEDKTEPQTDGEFLVAITAGARLRIGEIADNCLGSIVGSDPEIPYIALWWKGHAIGYSYNGESFELEEVKGLSNSPSTLSAKDLAQAKTVANRWASRALESAERETSMPDEERALRRQLKQKTWALNELRRALSMLRWEKEKKHEVVAEHEYNSNWLSAKDLEAQLYQLPYAEFFALPGGYVWEMRESRIRIRIPNSSGLATYVFSKLSEKFEEGLTLAGEKLVWFPFEPGEDPQGRALRAVREAFGQNDDYWEDAPSRGRSIRWNGVSIPGASKNRHVDQIRGGRADKRKPSDFDPKQLKLGIQIEMEHTKDRRLAREIAMDHLAEFPDYYLPWLVNMEKKAEAAKRRRAKRNPAMDTDPLHPANWIGRGKNIAVVRGQGRTTCEFIPPHAVEAKKDFLRSQLKLGHEAPSIQETLDLLEGSGGLLSFTVAMYDPIYPMMGGKVLRPKTRYEAYHLMKKWMSGRNPESYTVHAGRLSYGVGLPPNAKVQERAKKNGKGPDYYSQWVNMKKAAKKAKKNPTEILFAYPGPDPARPRGWTHWQDWAETLRAKLQYFAEKWHHEVTFRKTTEGSTPAIAAKFTSSAFPTWPEDMVREWNSKFKGFGAKGAVRARENSRTRRNPVRVGIHALVPGADPRFPDEIVHLYAQEVRGGHPVATLYPGGSPRGSYTSRTETDVPLSAKALLQELKALRALQDAVVFQVDEEGRTHDRSVAWLRDQAEQARGQIQYGVLALKNAGKSNPETYESITALLKKLPMRAKDREMLKGLNRWKAQAEQLGREASISYQASRFSPPSSKRNPLSMGPYPFARKEEQYAGFTSEQLKYAYRDAIAARDAMKGWNPDAEGWYADDAATIRAEVMKRRSLAR